MKAIELEVITSFATIALVILALAVFIHYHAGALFYALAAATIIVGFANAWLISIGGRRPSRAQPQSSAPKRAVKKRRGK